MNYSLHPEAEEDLRDAAEFYRHRAGNNLSQSLLREFEQSVNTLMRHPGLGSPWRAGGRRRYFMKRFPYSLVYTASSEEISMPSRLLARKEVALLKGTSSFINRMMSGRN